MAFRTTIWTQIREAAGRDPAAAEAFVRRYRVPLLSFLRRRGFSAEDAEDLGQEVFLQLFERDLLGKAEAGRGRFRSYLLGITNYVVQNHAAYRDAKKRGGDWSRVPIESAQIPANEADPEFDACWSDGLVGAALERLRDENERQHGILRLHLDSPELSQQELGERVGRTASQVKTDLHRARRRLIKLIKQEIARYTSSEDEFADELKVFLRVVGAQE